MNGELEKLFASAARVESYLRSGMVSREVAYAQLLSMRTVDDAGRVWLVLPSGGVLRAHQLPPGSPPVPADPALFSVSTRPSFSVWKKLRRLDPFPSSLLVRAGTLLLVFVAALVWMLPSGNSRGMAMLHRDPPLVIAESCDLSCDTSRVVRLLDSRVSGEASLSEFCAAAAPGTPLTAATKRGSVVECSFGECKASAVTNGGTLQCRTTPSKP